MKYLTKPRRVTSKGQITLPADALKIMDASSFTMKYDAQNIVLTPIKNDSLKDLVGILPAPKNQKPLSKKEMRAAYREHQIDRHQRKNRS